MSSSLDKTNNMNISTGSSELVKYHVSNVEEVEEEDIYWYDEGKNVKGGYIQINFQENDIDLEIDRVKGARTDYNYFEEVNGLIEEYSCIEMIGIPYKYQKRNRTSNNISSIFYQVNRSEIIRYLNGQDILPPFLPLPVRSVGIAHPNYEEVTARYERQAFRRAIKHELTCGFRIFLKKKIQSKKERATFINGSLKSNYDLIPEEIILIIDSYL